MLYSRVLSAMLSRCRNVRRSATVSFDEGLAGIVRTSTWSETQRLVPQLEQVLEGSEAASMDFVDSVELG